MNSGAEDLGLWDATAPSYVEQAGAGNSFSRRFAGFMWSQLGQVAGLDVLDLGCGHGWLAEEIRRAGARVVGVDGSAALLAEARRRYPAVRFERRDLTGRTAAAAATLRPSSRAYGVDGHSGARCPDRGCRRGAAPRGIPGVLDPASGVLRAVHCRRRNERYRKVTGYLTHETRWIESFGGHRHYHRPLSWYADLVCRHGLVITGLHEPPSLTAADAPEDERTAYQRWFTTVPTMLAMSCRK